MSAKLQAAQALESFKDEVGAALARLAKKWPQDPTLDRMVKDTIVDTGVFLGKVCDRQEVLDP